MSFRRMSRMISFRVSEDEFELLRAKSEAHGARSISDYARAVLCRSVNRDTETDLRYLNDGIGRLSIELRRLFDLLDSPRATLSERRQGPSHRSEGVGNA